MPFDGRHYQALPLLYPTHAHPDAPAAPTVPAGALEASYANCRLGSRLIGCQTNLMFQLEPRIHQSVRLGYAQITWVDEASFRRRRPAHFTHALFTSIFTVWPAEICYSHHRILATDTTGSTVATGTDYSEEHSVGLHLDDPPGGFWDREIVLYKRGVVSLATLDVNEMVEFTVQAYCVGISGSGIYYRPEMVIAEFAAVG